MCGIAGIISLKKDEINTERLQKMSAALRHRGPDGESCWISPTGHTGFAHTRLAIIDLSSAASQPMHYLGRYTIVFNGEIYNYIEIKAELQKAGYAFHSKSDTEVILAAYDCYQEKCLQYFDGMFAFIIWDEVKKIAFAARDRFGEKPFFYVKNEHFFAFASEMKALWAAGICQKSIEPKMMLNYLAIGQVKNADDRSQTFFSDIFSLPPSHYIIHDLRAGITEINNYWDIDKQQKIEITERNAIEKLDALFQNSVKLRLRSDVKLGCSLSGGLDSSSIAWYVNKLLQKTENKNFATFSAIFPGFEKNEQEHIDNVCTSLRLENYSCTPTADDLIQQFEKLLWHQEEPFQSSSVFAQYKVFELAAQHKVPVLLDGQGADEILAGYHRYLHWYLQELMSHSKFARFRNEKKQLHINKIPVRWNMKNVAAAYLPSHAAMSLEKREFNSIRYNHDVSKELLASLKGREWDGIHKPVVTKLNDILYFNVMEHGLEELLRYADRNSMAHGCEVRLPFLNADLVKFIFSLPSSFKISNGYPKWIWRKLMNNKLSDSITWRTDKTGFEPPQESWMANDRMQEFIMEARKTLVKERILKKQVLEKKIIPLAAHLPDNMDWRYVCAAYM